MTLDELITKIQIRPGSFLGDDIDIKSLYHFINGFLCFKQMFNLLSDSENHFNELFRKFIINDLSNSEHINRISSFKTWYEMIQYIATSNKDSLKLFFIFYDKFTHKIKDVD